MDIIKREGLKAFIFRNGLEHLSEQAQVEAWYRANDRDNPTPKRAYTNEMKDISPEFCRHIPQALKYKCPEDEDYVEGDLEAIQAFHAKVIPAAPEPEVDPREAFLEKFYVSPTYMYQDLLGDFDGVEVSKSKRPIEDLEIDWLGTEPEDLEGASKQERTYAIGKIYLENKARNGKRRGGVLSEKIAEKFGITERTVRRAAQFAEACDKMPGFESTMAKKVGAAKAASTITGDWKLKPINVERWTAPWKQFDGMSAYDAKEAALRLEEQ